MLTPHLTILITGGKLVLRPALEIIGHVVKELFQGSDRDRIAVCCSESLWKFKEHFYKFEGRQRLSLESSTETSLQKIHSVLSKDPKRKPDDCESVAMYNVILLSTPFVSPENHITSHNG